MVFGEAKMEVKMALKKYMEEKYLFGIAHGQKRSIISSCICLWVCERDLLQDIYQEKRNQTLKSNKRYKNITKLTYEFIVYRISNTRDCPLSKISNHLTIKMNWKRSNFFYLKPNIKFVGDDAFKNKGGVREDHVVPNIIASIYFYICPSSNTCE